MTRRTTPTSSLENPPPRALPRISGRATRALETLADRLGLSVNKRGGAVRVEGTRDVHRLTVRVRIEPIEPEDAPQRDPYAPPPVDVRIVLEPEKLDRRIFVVPRKTRRLGADSGVGDPQFDAAYHCRDRTAPYLAALGDEARRRLLRLADPLEIAGGRLTQPTHGLLGNLEALLARIEELFEVAHALSTPATLCTLRKRAMFDPAPRIREAALRHLIRTAPTARQTRSACRSACTDPDAAVRAAAAVHRGRGGLDAAVRVVLDLRAPTRARREVLPLLRAELPFGRAHTVFAELLAGQRFRTEAARALGERYDNRVIPTLVAALPFEAAAEALGAFDRPEVEQALVPLLDHPLPEVQRAAAASLRRVGRHRAAAALGAARRDSTVDTATRDALEQAYRTVRRRIEGIPGALSVCAKNPHGALSISGGSGGSAGSLSPTRTSLPAGA